MAQRDELFRKFGPILLEALVVSLVELINEHRRARGWPDITTEEVLTRMENHATTILPYNWMDEGEP